MAAACVVALTHALSLPRAQQRTSGGNSYLVDNNLRLWGRERPVKRLWEATLGRGCEFSHVLGIATPPLTPCPLSTSFLLCCHLVQVCLSLVTVAIAKLFGMFDFQQ